MSIEAKRCKDRYWFVRAISDVVDVPFVGIGDLHRGLPQFDIKSATRVRQWIADHNAFWIGMGDYMEMGTKGSIGASVFEQVEKPQDQEDWIIEFFKPIASTCLGLLKGNHEERAHKATGLDPVQTIAKAVGVPYLGWEGFGSISKPKTGAFTFYACHHYNGHKSMGLLEAWSSREVKVNADIIMLGHSHDKGAILQEYISIDPNNKNVQHRPRYVVGTGHYLRRADSYVAAGAGRPKPIGTIAVWCHLVDGNMQMKIEDLS